jgi:hypothetical protein
MIRGNGPGYQMKTTSRYEVSTEYVDGELTRHAAPDLQILGCAEG